MNYIEDLYDRAIEYINKSTCIYRSYCAIIVDEQGNHTFGYNYAPSTYKDCKKLNHCHRKEMQKKYCEEAEFFEVCQVIHAEMDVLLKISSDIKISKSSFFLLGINNDTGSIYKDASPCELCKKLLISKGFNDIFVFQSRNEIKNIKLI